MTHHSSPDFPFTPRSVAIPASPYKDAVYRREAPMGRFEYISPFIEQLVGFTPDEMARKTPGEILDRIHPEDREGLDAALETGVGRSDVTATFRFRHKDGRYRWLEDHAGVIADGNGAPLYRIGYLRDITDAMPSIIEPVQASTITLELRTRPHQLTATRFDFGPYVWGTAIAATLLLVFGLSVMLSVPSRFGGHVPTTTASLAETGEDGDGNPQQQLDAIRRERDALREQVALIQRQPGTASRLAVQSPLIPGKRSSGTRGLAANSPTRTRPAEAEVTTPQLTAVASPPILVETPPPPPVVVAPIQETRVWVAAAPQPVAADPPYAR